MELLIAGIEHSDPLGRTALADWIKWRRASQGSEPAFVAVEWDPEHFAIVRDQRPKLVDLARNVWPEAPMDFLLTLSRAMGFEADTHTTLLPDVPSVWLEEGRHVDDRTVLTMYAEDRLSNYRTMFSSRLNSFGLDQLEWMCEYVWKSIDCNKPPTPRDKQFADTVLSHTSPQLDGWAILVVGVCHSRPGYGFMRDMLDDLGFICQSSDVHRCKNAADEAS